MIESHDWLKLNINTQCSPKWTDVFKMYPLDACIETHWEHWWANLELLLNVPGGPIWNTCSDYIPNVLCMCSPVTFQEIWTTSCNVLKMFSAVSRAPRPQCQEGSPRVAKLRRGYRQLWLSQCSVKTVITASNGCYEGSENGLGGGCSSSSLRTS